MGQEHTPMRFTLTFQKMVEVPNEKGGVIDSDLLAYMMGHRNTFEDMVATTTSFDPDYIRREYFKAEPFPLSLVKSHLIWSGYFFGSPTCTSEAYRHPVTAKPLQARGNQQHVVSEWELDTYFDNGWSYVATLPSGRIVVKCGWNNAVQMRAQLPRQVVSMPTPSNASGICEQPL